MRLRRPAIVADASSFAAALDADDPAHEPMRAELTRVLAQVGRDELVLVTHSDALLAAGAALTARGHHPSVHQRLWALGAACSLAPLHSDLLADAEAVRRAAADHGLTLQPAQAITIELARRHGATEVLSTDPAYGAVGLVVRPDHTLLVTSL